MYKELRILGALGVDVADYRAALDLLVSGRYPFETLLRSMAGEADDPPPVHGVITP